MIDQARSLPGAKGLPKHMHLVTLISNDSLERRKKKEISNSIASCYIRAINTHDQEAKQYGLQPGTGEMWPIHGSS